MMELRKRSRAFEQIGGIWATSGTITGTAEPEQVRLAFTTANFLPLLAEKPQLGRFFAPGEEDRKSTRLNSSHGYISYAVFCLKKQKLIVSRCKRRLRSRCVSLRLIASN